MLERNDQFQQEDLAATRGNSVLERGYAKLRGINRLFAVTVAIPTTVAILYFGLFASDTYISESRFVVRSPEKGVSSGLGALLKGSGFSNAGDEVYAAHDYVISRDALRELNRGDQFAKAYGANSISAFDRFGGLWSSTGFEDLFRYYGKKVEVEYDSSSAITKLTVRAYSSEAAQRFNEQLLEMAEATVNRLNERGRQDLIRFSAKEVENAKEAARNAAVALSVFRNREGIVDPEQQAAIQLQMISKLQDNLISTKTQLVQLRTFAGQNPQVPVLQARIEELKREISEEQGKVAGGSKSLAASAVQYQRLALERLFADRQLASAMASFESARNEARRKQAYVERIVQPNKPDKALEPRRWRGILATFALGMVAWGVLGMLLAGLKEHRD